MGSQARDYMIAAQHETLTHDLDGNLAADSLWTYTYDAENRLVRMTSLLPAGQGFTRRQLGFIYDYLGRRIAKTVDGVETRYVLDGANVVEEHDASGALTAFNLYAGLDQLLMRRDYGTGATYWMQTDHLGSVESLTDAAGTVVERYRYGSFWTAVGAGAGFLAPRIGAIDPLHLHGP
jgi:YD repeat-containing protein